ncbi:Origin recognition complex subunit 2 [Wickerhamomyces ciferrii]|uniref:Origin recognition complex subunit 2 n=1 Tax=Wickerhamomyces ciferrii (strain ATCC 14091 / BCRC 22168 / CBS 111 / JCM 3599 / NBRC 0793 / NRRL Y-1031 F-60-10) TaxID=1206466 RepID=K0KSJ2_WICCF|nr:Origin recognition complex subunit 2 [Wickerhamomyces ciferrii]CCH44304.1 Origin recognition complex subunit 2 [Wickerhamomyces ciferrii]
MNPSPQDKEVPEPSKLTIYSFGSPKKQNPEPETQHNNQDDPSNTTEQISNPPLPDINSHNPITNPQRAIDETIIKLSPSQSSLPFRLRPRVLTSLDELESEDELYIPKIHNPDAKKKAGRPKKETGKLAQLLNIKGKRGRPKKNDSLDSDNDEVESRFIGGKRSIGRPKKNRDPLISVEGGISAIISRDSDDQGSTPEIIPKTENQEPIKLNLKECIVEFEPQDVLNRSLRYDSDFNSDDSGSESGSYISEDESRDWKPTNRYAGSGEGNKKPKRKRGRPSKYEPPLHRPSSRNSNNSSKPRGRPRKDGSPAHPLKQTIKTELKPDSNSIGNRTRGRPKNVQLEETKVKEEKPEGLIEFEYDDDMEDDLTNFVFIKAEHDANMLKKTRGRPTLSVVAKQQEQQKIIKADVFSSPKRQKLGAITLAETELSPSKKGILTLEGSSPIKTPNGRAGSPRKQKLRRAQQDQSARKRATKTLYQKLMEDDMDEDDDYFEGQDYEEEKRLAERIIEESRKSVSAAPSPFNTPRHNRVHGTLPVTTPNFVATPLPTAEEEEVFFDSKYEDKALFLDGPDGYFDQHRTKIKGSNNSMVKAPQLEYDEFNSLILLSGFLHNKEKQKLIDTYKEMYTQWYFELTQGFNLLLFGVGSKRRLALNFVEEYLTSMVDIPALVVNGYNPATSFKEVLTTIVSALKLHKVPKRLGDLVDHIVDYYHKRADTPRLILLIHNIDGTGLRDEKTQIYLSKLASIKQIYVIATVDHINAPLLWDSSSLDNFHFAWHNTTTFADYLTESSFQDIMTLGQTQKSSGSKGAKYVLSSLTSNSKGLYRVLVSNQLQNMEDDLTSKKAHGGGDTMMKGTIKHALEYKNFYSLCAEEFISSNEINFRTMLMEFVEHKMAVLTKDQSGSEMVFIPFTLEELQKLLEDELL